MLLQESQMDIVLEDVESVKMCPLKQVTCLFIQPDLVDIESKTFVYAHEYIPQLSYINQA